MHFQSIFVLCVAAIQPALAVSLLSTISNDKCFVSSYKFTPDGRKVIEASQAAPGDGPITFTSTRDNFHMTIQIDANCAPRNPDDIQKELPSHRGFDFYTKAHNLPGLNPRHN